ncbi:MAG: hypothetical protein Q4D80_06720, partial [Pseudomonadota bacterium]|nr:hypothetical protein [Pseudomonadota bacterium]
KTGGSSGSPAPATTPNTTGSPAGDNSNKPNIYNHSDGSRTETITDKNGNTTEKDYYADGKLDAIRSTDKNGNNHWKTYNKDGSIRMEGAANADGSGFLKEHNEQGKLIYESYNDKNGNEQWKTYNEDGSTKMEGSLKDGTRNCKTYENGRVIKDETWQENK